MPISPWVEYAAGFASIGVFSRLWVRFRRDRAAKREYATPLFDPKLLDRLFEPNISEGDDPDVFAEVRSTLSHLNRAVYADEFWGLDRQLASYYSKLPKLSRPTMRRALIRMLTSENRWLQVVAAKSCSSIGLPEALAPLKEVVVHQEALVKTGTEAAISDRNSADSRFQAELATALSKLESALKSAAKDT